MKKIFALMVASLLYAGSICAAPVKPKLVETFTIGKTDGSKNLFSLRDYVANKKKIAELSALSHCEPAPVTEISMYRFNSFEPDIEETFMVFHNDLERLVLKQHQIVSIFQQLRHDRRFVKAPSNLFLFKDPEGCLKVFALMNEGGRFSYEIMCLTGQSLPGNCLAVGNIFVPTQH